MSQAATLIGFDGVFPEIALALRYDFLQQALAGTVLMGIACGLMGALLLLRRMALFGDAIGHAVLPGVMVGYLLGGKQFAWIFAGALLAGMVAASAVFWIPQASRLRPDAAMGAVFTGMFGLGIALLSRYQSGSGGVSGLLFGHALGIGPSEVTWAFGNLLVVLLLLGVAWKPLKLMSFDPIQAEVTGAPTRALTHLLMLVLTATIVVSLPMVGAVLVAALLILPAAAASLVARHFGTLLLLAGTGGGASALVGLWASHTWGLASGASIVLSASALFVLVGCVSGARKYMASVRHG